MKSHHRRIWGLALALYASHAVITQRIATAEDRNPDIAQIERDLADAGRAGTLPQLQKAWQVRFTESISPGEKLSLDVLPAIPVMPSDPVSQQRFDRLREQVKQAFEHHRQDTGVFTLVLRDGQKLLTSQGMVIPLKFVFRRTMISTTDTHFAGIGQSGCLITTQFFATGTREPLRLGENAQLTRFHFSRDGVAALQGYQGPHGEIVVFQRQNNDPVQVSLEFTDPELGQVTRYAPVALSVCADAVAPPPPPPPPPPVFEAPPPVAEAPPPPVAEPVSAPAPFLPGGFTWGVAASIGIGIIAEPGYGTSYGGFASGLSARLGYYFSPRFALLAEPRLTGMAGPAFQGYKASAALVAQVHFAKIWVLSGGPSIGFAGSDRYRGSSIAGGFAARFGADIPLHPTPSGRPRAISLRLEAEPLFMPVDPPAHSTIVGSLSHIGFSVGYESY